MSDGCPGCGSPNICTCVSQLSDFTKQEQTIMSILNTNERLYNENKGFKEKLRDTIERHQKGVIELMDLRIAERDELEEKLSKAVRSLERINDVAWESSIRDDLTGFQVIFDESNACLTEIKGGSE